MGIDNRNLCADCLVGNEMIDCEKLADKLLTAYDIHTKKWRFTVGIRGVFTKIIKEFLGEKKDEEQIDEEERQRLKDWDLDTRNWEK